MTSSPATPDPSVPPQTGAHSGRSERDELSRAERRRAWQRLVLALVILIAIVLVLTVVPLGKANQTRTSSIRFSLPVGPIGVTDQFSSQLPTLCSLARSDANTSGDRSLVLTWETTGGGPVSRLQLVATEIWPWTTFYEASNVSSGTFTLNASTEVGVACSPGLDLIAVAPTPTDLGVTLTLSCTYSVAAPLL